MVITTGVTRVGPSHWDITGRGEKWWSARRVGNHWTIIGSAGNRVPAYGPTAKAVQQAIRDFEGD